MGSFVSATPPTIKMTIESTVAAIGRSMKKYEIKKHLEKGGDQGGRNSVLRSSGSGRRCGGGLRLAARIGGLDRLHRVVDARRLDPLHDQPIVRRDHRPLVSFQNDAT